MIPPSPLGAQRAPFRPGARSGVASGRFSCKIQHAAKIPNPDTFALSRVGVARGSAQAQLDRLGFCFLGVTKHVNSMPQFVSPTDKNCQVLGRFRAKTCKNSMAQILHN